METHWEHGIVCPRAQKQQPSQVYRTGTQHYKLVGRILISLIISRFLSFPPSDHVAYFCILLSICFILLFP